MRKKKQSEKMVERQTKTGRRKIDAFYTHMKRNGKKNMKEIEKNIRRN